MQYRRKKQDKFVCAVSEIVGTYDLGHVVILSYYTWDKFRGVLDRQDRFTGISEIHLGGNFTMSMGRQTPSNRRSWNACKCVQCSWAIWKLWHTWKVTIKMFDIRYIYIQCMIMTLGNLFKILLTPKTCRLLRHTYTNIYNVINTCSQNPYQHLLGTRCYPEISVCIIVQKLYHNLFLKIHCHTENYFFHHIK